MDILDIFLLTLAGVTAVIVCAVAVGYWYARAQERKRARLTPLLGVVLPREDKEDA